VYVQVTRNGMLVVIAVLGSSPIYHDLYWTTYPVGTMEWCGSFRRDDKTTM